MNDKYTREAFIKALDLKVSSICGMGPDDLPDVVMIDDYYHEGMSLRSFNAAVKECALVILEEAGYDPSDE